MKLKTCITWLAAITALTLTAAIAIHFAEAACRVPRHREALAISKAAGCLEFWINRYQQTITAIIAASIAIAALVPVWAQVKSANLQARSGRSDILRRRVGDLQEELTGSQIAVYPTLPTAAEIDQLRQQDLALTARDPSLQASFFSFSEKAGKIKNAIEAVAQRTAVPDLTDARKEVVKAANNLKSSTESLRKVWPTLDKLGIQKTPAQADQPKLVELAGVQLNRAEEFVNAVKSYQGVLATEITKAWSLVDRIESEH